MTNQKESKTLKINSWLIKLLSRDMKTNTKNKDQPTNKYKDNRIIKVMGKITITINYYLRIRQMGDNDP